MLLLWLECKKDGDIRFPFGVHASSFRPLTLGGKLPGHGDTKVTSGDAQIVQVCSQ